MNNELGRGGFGVVRRAHLDGQVVAAKILRSDESKDIRVAKRLVREMKIWAGLCHPNVLPLIGFYLSQTLDRAIIVCPLVPHGSLQDFIMRDKPSDACRLRLAHDTLSGLIYLHGLRPPVIHGDIKAANALVYQGPWAVLSDFGLAVAASESPSGLTTSHGLLGAIRWWSPELFNGGPRSASSDIWAWACLLLEVMKGRVPYSWVEQDVLVFRAAWNGMLPDPEDELKGPLDLWSVIRMCWEVAPEKRETGAVVLKRLETLINIVERHDSHRWASLLDRATRRYTKFLTVGNRVDLDAAIAHQQEVVQTRPPGHPGRSAIVENMAMYFDTRFKGFGNHADLDAAIAYQQAALQLRPPGHPDRPNTVYNMAVYLDVRATIDSNSSDRDAAIGYYQESLQLQRSVNSDCCDSLRRLASHLHSRFVQDGNLADLDAAIAYQREAVQLRPIGHPKRSKIDRKMATYLGARRAATDAKRDAAVIVYQPEDLQPISPEQPEYALALINMLPDLRMEPNERDGQKDLSKLTTWLSKLIPHRRFTL
ncbi:hypothetical protein FRB93_011719 [Tulasnella sp. JGI-2019a]|nr:hypothetical protein FRB93_011719 [Tulasnella sp. JGI-2019a]